MNLPPIKLRRSEVFASGSPEVDIDFINIDAWASPVTYFVGRNGSGKSRTARAIAGKAPSSSYLSTDRLLGLMNVSGSGFSSKLDDFDGFPLTLKSGAMNDFVQSRSRSEGMAAEHLVVLRDQPDVGLRVSAFIKRALGRTIDLRETAGLLDPFIRVGGREYSLLRDEGHGLRELVVLLTAVYRSDWQLLVVDEPELHLHPSMVRLWVSELDAVCRASGRRAILVTHEPSIVRPTSADDLRAMWHFDISRPPLRVSDCIDESAVSRVTESLRSNPSLLSQLVFSPRPVLVEGINDVAALTVALSRSSEASVVAQTELVGCGGSNKVAMWFAISKKLGIDVRAIGDLDAILDSDVQRWMDLQPDVNLRYAEELYESQTHKVVRPLIDAADKAGVPKNSKDRAAWIAQISPHEMALFSRLVKTLEIWEHSGFRLHREGTIEDVLGGVKGQISYTIEAEKSGPIDDVANWAAYELDPSGEVLKLLTVAVERIANGINVRQALDPQDQVNFGATTGGVDFQLVDVVSIDTGGYRLTVKMPEEYRGYWMDFSRATAPNDMRLQPPSG